MMNLLTFAKIIKEESKGTAGEQTVYLIKPFVHDAPYNTVALSQFSEHIYYSGTASTMYSDLLNCQNISDKVKDLNLKDFRVIEVVIDDTDTNHLRHNRRKIVRVI